MAFPLFRPHRSSFSESLVVSDLPTTTSLTGRKRTIQAAGLNDVSVEDDDDDANDDDATHKTGMTKKSVCEKAIEGDDLRESRRVSSTGRRRSSAKGARKEGESPTASSTSPKGRTIAESDAEDKAHVSPQIKELDATLAIMLATSEPASPPTDIVAPLLETFSNDTTVHPSTDMQGAKEISAIASVNGTVDEGTDIPSDKERSCAESELEAEKVWGMPDWAAELDEVVPGVKVMSIHDVLLDYHQMDTPTSVLFPWLHGIGDGPLGANGPLEQFFGNPSLTPPRYRGLCILKAPPVTAGNEHSSSVESMQPLRSSSSASKSDNESWERHYTASNNVGPSDPASPHTSRDRAASTSTFLSTMSSATWASTDSSEPSLYSIRSSPQSVTTIGTDCGGKSPDSAGLTRLDSMSFTDDIDRNEGNAAGQPVEVAMHPTCSKRTLGVETPSRDGASFGNGVTLAALQTTMPLSDVEIDADVDMEGEVELQIPPSVSHDSVSPIGTRTPQTSPPPTPQAPLSAHPTEENSILRTASGKGRVRSASPTPINNAGPKCLSELLIHADSDRNGHAFREDAQVDHAEWPHNVHDADLLRDPQAAENQSSTWQNRSMLVNAIKTDDILDIDVDAAQGVFKKPDLGGEVSLRNLRIQEIKYGSVADLLLYSEEGISADSAQDLRDSLIRTAFSIARAQARLYQERLVSFYSDLQVPPGSPFSQPSDKFQSVDEMSAQGIEPVLNDTETGKMVQDLPDGLEGQVYSADDLLLQLRDRKQWQNDHLRERPIMYNVVVIKESFAEIQRLYPELVGIDENGVTQPSRDLWLKEAEESIKLAGASELGENIWAHDLADIPTETTAYTLKQVLTRRVKPKRSLRHPIAPTRSQHLPPDDEPIYLEIASSSRARQCMQNSHEVLADRLIALADTIYALTNPRGTKANPVRTLVFCDDGYTETSVFALTYLMVSRKLSLKEAYLHLQLTCKRSFFVYQFDVPFLSVIERKLAARNVAFKNCAVVRPSSPLSKWKTFGLSSSKSAVLEKKSDTHPADSSVVNAADSWINSDKFDGSLPSRILHHVYLGNIAHAMNSEMLKDLGITHVVSVGETLSAEGTVVQGHYISVSGLSAHVGEVQDSLGDTPIKVLEIQDVKDDGNDPLRPKIAHACEFIHQAGKMGAESQIPSRTVGLGSGDQIYLFCDTSGNQCRNRAALLLA
ncbi:hypothetical protein QFC22_000102 [Naganishia vaughanmartiniae]|uniref:Uncharacterized protein n=1 Tax=Naganishia vaughanmartiniae TaxID=1424756 RepID=A0ACC2XNE9_9TREE|nr:hypothetical protein QFC22_000102 [Naganishia vaughanmartiniae]